MSEIVLEEFKPPHGTLFVYLAIPMNGEIGIFVNNRLDDMMDFVRERHPTHEIEFVNKDAIQQAAKDAGPSPIRYSRAKGEFRTMGECLSMMNVADVVYFHPDWARSKGCHIEVEACRHYGKPIAIIPEYVFE